MGVEGHQSWAMASRFICVIIRPSLSFITTPWKLVPDDCVHYSYLQEHNLSLYFWKWALMKAGQISGSWYVTECQRVVSLSAPGSTCCPNTCVITAVGGDECCSLGCKPPRWDLSLDWLTFSSALYGKCKVPSIAKQIRPRALILKELSHLRIVLGKAWIVTDTQLMNFQHKDISNAK